MVLFFVILYRVRSDIFLFLYIPCKDRLYPRYGLLVLHTGNTLRQTSLSSLLFLFQFVLHAPHHLPEHTLLLLLPYIFFLSLICLCKLRFFSLLIKISIQFLNILCYRLIPSTVPILLIAIHRTINYFNITPDINSMFLIFWC